MHLSEQERIRRQSLAELRKLGIEPYPAAAYEVTDHIGPLLEGFVEGKQVKLAGRLMSRRIMGKASFGEMLDSSGRMQLYFNRDEMCQGEDKTLYNNVFKKLLDYGDFIGVEGETFRTQVGEPSVKVTKMTVLSKTLRPLPVVKEADGQVYDAFSDPELRYRMRYVDLVVNDGVKDTFLKRTKIIQAMREFINARGYMEVDTPVLQPIPGGAAARPFITHHNALDIPLYLRIANELYLKRLIVGGFEGVYEFSRNFRNEGMDRTHNPEFTVMEIYVAYKDYHWMMEFTENMMQHICQEVNGQTQVTLGGKEINFAAPYSRVSMRDAILEHTGFDIDGKDEAALRAACADESGEEQRDAAGRSARPAPGAGRAPGGFSFKAGHADP